MYIYIYILFLRVGFNGLSLRLTSVCGPPAVLTGLLSGVNLRARGASVGLTGPPSGVEMCACCLTVGLTSPPLGPNLRAFPLWG